MPQLLNTINSVDRGKERQKPQKVCVTKKNTRSNNGYIFRIAYGHGMGPTLLRQTLLEMGMTEFDSRIHKESQWNLWWKGYRFKEEELQFLKEFQRVNHHPAPIGRQADIIKKDGLLRAVRRMCAVYPKCASLLLYPLTYHLPREETQFINMFSQNSKNSKKKSGTLKCLLPWYEEDETLEQLFVKSSLKSELASSKDAHQDYSNNIWILKPADQSRGKGIYLFDRLNDMVYFSKSVVQRYITDPLLISGYKFDLRLYAVVPSYAPFIVYINSDGLVRFATERYDLSDLKNVYSHLTNTSINVNGPEYLANKTGIGRGCKWTVTQLRQWMNEHKINDRVLWIRIQVLIVLTLLSQASSIPKVPNAYELFGFDILIDSQLRPWLIEVNANPSLSSDCIIDETVKKPLLMSVLEMLRLHQPETQTVQNIVCLDETEPITISIQARSMPQLMQTRVASGQWRSERKKTKTVPTSTSSSVRKLDSLCLSDMTLPEQPVLSDTQSNGNNPPKSSSLSQSIDASLGTVKPKHFRLHQQTIDQFKAVLNQQPQLPDSEACPLYGRGSEHLLSELQALNKRFPGILEAEKRISRTLSQNNTLYCPSSRTNINVAVGQVKPCGEAPQVKAIKDKYFAPIPIPAQIEEDKVGSHLIPHSFGKLKLAFPFNLITRIACAKERSAYPDVKVIVRAASRLVNHVTRISQMKSATLDKSIMDIPPIWEMKS